MSRLASILLGLYLGITFFMPKEPLFYTAQKYLKSKNNIYLNSKTESSFIKLTLKDAVLFVDGMDVATLKECDIYPFLLYNKVEIKNLLFSIDNLKVKNLILTYSIVRPTLLDIKGSANFGTIEGSLDLKERFIKVYVKKASNRVKRFLRKDKEGYYYYEKF